jgi:hypothetical protein
MTALVITIVTPLQREFEEVNAAGISAFLAGQFHRRKLFQMVLKALEERGS